MKQSPVIMIIIALCATGLGFFGGMQYQKSQRPSFRNGQFPMGTNGPTGTFGMRGTRNGNQPVSGEITTVDDTGITVKMRDGSSKIIILSSSSVINKATVGSKTDLTKGTEIMAFGTTNTDGSITAQTITIGGGLFGRGPNGGPANTGETPPAGSQPPQM